ncbi:putative triacylglycerol lipase [Rhodococcus sp. AW25M09]|uniref:esterase/lipase family protein n=1 Tax=Rhodococcus sp. AW25M09 TaxID=1268303 RepID=UPI0002ABD06F|nr:alpha/beta fold hydrolase [Rhodococcus sp. AW25M09]CCQ17327.1 putative triacylglycerol lipase [Rhodococcus sp. AW25M09]
MPNNLSRNFRATLLVAIVWALSFVGNGIAVAEPLPPGVSVSTTPQLVGANDFGCVPSAAHPRPVVLVHGTKMDASAWETLAPQLQSEGYCVFALNYGGVSLLLDPSQIVWGSGDIVASGRQLATFVDEVLQSTGAAQVDMVGHSQGGVTARQYMKFDGGTDLQDPSRNKVHTLVTLGATNHGTTFGGLQQLSTLLTSLGLPGDALAPLAYNMAGAQQLVGSSTLVSLNDGGDVQPGVDYTVIATRNDAVSTPAENTFLRSGDALSVRNIWVQDLCPAATTSHIGLVTDPVPLYMVKSALDVNYAANSAPPC